MKIFILFLTTCSILFGGVFDFKTIKSDFIQTIVNEENSKIVYEGTFWATSNAKALWKYKKPVWKDIYFSKKQVVIIEPELEQAIITNIEDSPNITDILKQSKKIDKNIYETTYDGTTYKVVVENKKIKQILKNS